MSEEFRSGHSVKAQINSGRRLETNVLGNLNWQKHTIALEILQRVRGVCFGFGFFGFVLFVFLH